MKHSNSRPVRRLRLTAAAAAVAVTFAFTGCSSGDIAPASSDAGSGTSTAFGECAAAPLEGIDLERAQALVTSYQQPAESLIVSNPLDTPVTADTTVAFIDIGTVVSAIMWDYAVVAADRAGVQLERVQAGSNAQSINTALNTVVENEPDIVLAPTVDPTFWADQLKTLQDNGVTVVTGAITNAQDFGLPDGFGGYNTSVVNGEVLAAAAISMTCGTEAEFVFYNIPEFSFSGIQRDSAIAAFDDFCSDACTMRVVDIPVSQLTSGGPDAVLSDLQAHPKTAAFITPADELQVGLPQKMELAGIDVPGLGQSSTLPNVEQIVAGTQAGGFAVDHSMFMWLLFDQAFRQAQGMDYPEPKWAEINPQLSSILTKENADVALGGYIALPSYQEDFMALWGVK